MTAGDLEEVTHSAAGAPEVQSAGARPQGAGRCPWKQAVAIGCRLISDSYKMTFENITKILCRLKSQVASSIRVDLNNYFFTS